GCRRRPARALRTRGRGTTRRPGTPSAMRAPRCTGPGRIPSSGGVFREKRDSRSTRTRGARRAGRRVGGTSRDRVRIGRGTPSDDARTESLSLLTSRTRGTVAALEAPATNVEDHEVTYIGGRP